MKKTTLFLSSLLIITVGAWLLNSFSIKIGSSKIKNEPSVESIDYATKYSDCIDGTGLSSFSQKLAKLNSKTTQYSNGKTNSDLENYRCTLDSMVKNLNAIDAHDFLHSEYDQHEIEIVSDTISTLRSYYLLKAMEICYDLDRSMNLASVSLKNEK